MTNLSNSQKYASTCSCLPLVPIQTWFSSILNVSRTLLPDLLYMPDSGCGGSCSRRPSSPGKTSSGLPYLSSTVLCIWHHIILSHSFNSGFSGTTQVTGTTMSPFWILLELRTTEAVVTTAATRSVQSSSQIITINKPTPSFL